MKKLNVFRQIFVLLVCAGILNGAVAQVAAQVKRGGGINPKATAAVTSRKPACQGGWKGVVSYTRSLYEEIHTDDPIMGKIDQQKNRAKTDKIRSEIYRGRAVVADADPYKPVVNTQSSYWYKDTENGVMREWGTCHAFNDEHEFKTSSNSIRFTEGKASGSARSFNLFLDENRGYYTFSMQFPRFMGKHSYESHLRRKGFCQAKNNEPRDVTESFDVPIDVERLTVDFQKFDLKNPDVLEGTQIIDKNDRNNPKAVKVPVITIKWKFTRCPASLVVTDIRFQEPHYPSPNTLIDIPEGGATVDGNRVKIIATIANLSGQVKTADVTFKELKENTVLPEGTKGETFQPNEEKEVELEWDTSGYAWRDMPDGGQPEIDREIEVSVPTDRMVEEIVVKPKPVLVATSMWANAGATRTFMDHFKAVPNTKWMVFASPLAKDEQAAVNARTLETYIKNVQTNMNAWHVDVVAHSVAGLAARVYVDGLMPTQFDGRPTVSHLVMVGTPNRGTPCISGLGVLIGQLFNGSGRAMNEIKPDRMKNFNTMVNKQNGTKFTALSGIPLMKTCQAAYAGDGIVPNVSAQYRVRDRVHNSNPFRHEQLLADVKNFKETYKRFAIGPKGNHEPDGGTSGGLAAIDVDESIFTHRNYGASYAAVGSAADDDGPGEEDVPNFTRGLTVKPGQGFEIDLPVTSGSRMAINFFAPANVSITLTDASGTVAGSSLAGESESDGIFRTIYIDKAFQGGNWKIKVENTGQLEAGIALALFIDLPLAPKAK